MTNTVERAHETRPSKRSVKKKLVMGTTGLLVATSVLGISGMRADAFLTLPGPLQKLWDQGFSMVESYAGVAMQQGIFKGLEKLSGEFNLPDPGKLFTWLDEGAESGENSGDTALDDCFGAGSVQGMQCATISKARGVSDIGKTIGSSSLSTEGQKAHKQMAEGMNTAVNKMQECAEKASNSNVTQEVLQAMSCQFVIQGDMHKTNAMTMKQIDQKLSSSILMDSQKLELDSRDALKEAEELNGEATATVAGAVGREAYLEGALNLYAPK